MSEERKKHINHLKAMLKCYENQTSPTIRCDDCDNCELQYAQGNMGEIKETLTYAIASLETDEAYQLEYENLELCEDCISRKEAISWIENLRTLNEHYHPNAKDNHLIDCDSAIDYLKQIPSVLPKTNWISVSEKLPHDRDWHLGIFKEPYTNWINPVPFICDYVGSETKATTKEYWILRGFTDIDEPCDYYLNLECVAWMPLPEPYKPDKMESEDIDGK